MGDAADAVRAAGGLATEASPWWLAEVEDELLSGAYQGLILTGGGDVNPARYGERPHVEVYGVDNARDKIELAALEIALELDIPVLGICRGSQIMCVARGGKLTQHIGRDHVGAEHWVTAAPDARIWKRACGARDMSVISLHHQCVRKPGKGMRVAAYALDGTPESIESKDGRWLGVQYHPEINALDNGNSFAIFRWLVESAAEVLGGRAPARTFREAKRTRVSGIPATVAPARKSRQAGERAFATIDDMVTLIESFDSGGLLVCPDCGLEFDNVEDRDDHVLYLHDDLPIDALLRR